MKKYFMLFTIFLVFFIFKNAKALTFSGEIISAEYVGNIYVKKERGDGYYQYKHAKFLRKSTDNNYVYCLEPFVEINNYYDYEIVAKDYANILNLTDEDWQRVNLLSYYGYMYKDDTYDHTSDYWYYITQIAIWRTVDKKANIFFTDTLNGKKIERFTKEFNELEQLVKNHEIIPSFVLPKSNLKIHSKITITDTNNVLKYYNVTSSNNLKVSKNENTLTIEVLDAGKGKIEFTKMPSMYDHNPLIYYSTQTQKILETGNYYPVKTSLNLDIKGAQLKIIKIDSETGETISYNNINFQILNNDDKPICFNNNCIFSTNNSGEVTLPFTLAKGEYKIKELENSNFGNYQWNQEPITFVVDDNTDDLITIHFPNNRIKGKLTIYKYGETLKVNDNLVTYEKKLLNNVTFSIYAAEDILIGNKILYHQNDLITSFTTEDGKKEITLELGKYYLKEINTVDGYTILKDPLYFELNKENNNDEFVYKSLEIENYLIKEKIKLFKINKKNNTPLANALLAIYDNDDNLIFSGYTNEEGILDIPELPLGKYYVKELIAPTGYIINQEKMEFILKNDNEEVIKLYFYNEPEETIDVPDTQYNINYNYTFIIPNLRYIPKKEKVIFCF